MDKKKRNLLYENNLSALEDSESDFNDRFIIQ